MPEIDHVRGILNRPDLPGPPRYPAGDLDGVTSADRPPVKVGADENRPRQFIELNSPYLEDMVSYDDNYEDDDDVVGPYTPVRPSVYGGS